MKDDDGFDVTSGDWISFSYGIPPVRVDARLSEKKGKLVATVLGRHRPREIALSALRRHVGNWYKSDGPAGKFQLVIQLGPTFPESKGFLA